MSKYELNKNLAQMLKGGVIMDVVNAEQAIIAEKSGACAVMALEKVPSDIRKQGGVARMSDPKMIKEIQAAVSIPVMAKVRTIQIINWVSPTRAIPIILPIISWTGLTDETITSTTLLVFSSMTPLITCDPNIKTSIYIRNPPI